MRVNKGDVHHRLTIGGTYRVVEDANLGRKKSWLVVRFLRIPIFELSAPSAEWLFHAYTLHTPRKLTLVRKLTTCDKCARQAPITCYRSCGEDRRSSGGIYRCG